MSIEGCHSSATRTGGRRSGTSNRGGKMLERADQDNNKTYHDVISTGLGSLQYLGAEVFGKWDKQLV
eukprot:4927078-Pyramimonas_sp.AAC.1